MDPIGTLVEQVDGRRAEQRQIRAIDDAFERRVAAAQENHQLDLVRVHPFERPREPGQLEKAKALRKRKILLQQPVALKRAQGHRQQRLGVGEADRLDRRRGKKLVPPLRALQRQHQRARDRSPDTARTACSRRRRVRSDRNTAGRCASCENFSPAVVFSRIRTPPLMRCATGSALSGRSGANEK